MLKTYTSTSLLVPKRLKLVSLQHSSKMTNDATLSETRSQHPQQQPTLASQRAKQQTQAQQRPATYFPLGYKEAAQQWVCLLFVAALPNPRWLTAPVDQCVVAPGRAQCPFVYSLAPRSR